MSDFLNKVGEFFKGVFNNFLEVGIVFFCVVAVTVILTLAIKANKKGKFDSSAITYGGIAIALSMVLNLITVYSMPNGGSVTAGRILPLLIFSYLFGMSKGAVVGAVYGVLDFIAKPYFVNIFQFLLDYPLAFSCCCFGGLFRNNEKLSAFSLSVGTVFAGLGRFLFSSVSGALYWGMTFIPSMAYNSVLLIDTAVCLVVILLLSTSKSFRNLLISKKR